MIIGPNRIKIDIYINSDKTRTTVKMIQYRLWIFRNQEFMYEGPDMDTAICEAMNMLDTWEGK